MRNINTNSFSLNKYNPVNQFIDVFRQQLFKSVVAEGGGTDFSCSVERMNKNAANQLLLANVVGNTQKGGVILDISPKDDLPDLKNEIYRLVEKSFSVVGADTGKGIKTDHYNDENFNQLIVVKKEKGENFLLSGYRYALVSNSINNVGHLNTPMGNFFEFGSQAIDELKDGNAIELGTARVNKEVGRKAIYGLHGIRDGLVCLYDKYNNKYFVGKMTIPSETALEPYSEESRNFSIAYLKKFYSDGSFNAIVKPRSEFVYDCPDIDMSSLGIEGDFSLDREKVRDYLKKIDSQNVNGLFPNMFPIYMSRIRKINYIGTVQNGKVCESGIIVDCKQIREEEITSRQLNIDNWNERFGKSDIRYGDYLDMSKSL